jgi:hypothetical protein
MMGADTWTQTMMGTGSRGGMMAVMMMGADGQVCNISK